MIVLAEYRDLNALFNYLQKQINNTMENQVAEEVVNVVKGHVESDVYEAYQPKSYQREYQLLNNVKSTLINNGTIEINDIRMDGEKNVTQIVEYGSGYTWHGNLDETIGPRPFIENSIDDLSMNKQHVEALKKALISKGLQVE